jgi:hypothetical protein
MTYFYLALSPTSREVAWEMLKEDWNKTIKAFHIGWEYPIIDRVLLFATEERYTIMKKKKAGLNYIIYLAYLLQSKRYRKLC